MNPQLFGNLGQFNYGSLGDSPALMNMAQLYPQQQDQQMPGNPFLDFLRYISGLSNQLRPEESSITPPLGSIGGIRN